MSSIAQIPLLAVWYNWIIPLWLVVLGMGIATAAAFGLFGLLSLVAPKVAAIARVTAQRRLFATAVLGGHCAGRGVPDPLPFLPYNTFGEDAKVVKDSGMT